MGRESFRPSVASSSWRRRQRGGQQHIPRPPIVRPGRARAVGRAARPTGGAASRSTRCGRASPRCRPPADAVARAEGSRAAAVLVPLFEEDGEAYVVLIKRPDWMPSHRGEIAFPGGKFEPGVDADLRAAALREAHEEIGLAPGRRRGRRAARRHRHRRVALHDHAVRRLPARAARAHAGSERGRSGARGPALRAARRRRLPRGALETLPTPTSSACTSTSSRTRRCGARPRASSPASSRTSSRSRVRSGARSGRWRCGRRRRG